MSLWVALLVSWASKSKTVYLELVVMSVVPSQQLGLLTGSILCDIMTLLETQISH